jgi:tripartite-type tricarboxylate transporter receptor subunit TctC
MSIVTYGSGRLAIAIVLSVSLCAAPVVAQNYPSKPIRFIVPFPPGGCPGSRRGGWCWGGDGTVTPGLWHWTRRWFAITMMLMSSLWISPVVAQNYPSKPIRFIVPFPPGGGTDTVARVISQRLAEQLGQQVVIDNRGGANAIIGTEMGAKAAPDGYTLTFTLPAAVAVNPSLYPSLPYAPLRDFAPVTQLNTIALLLVAHPGVQANSIRELIALAKSKPGQLTFASSGNGSAAHLAMELFKLMAGVDMVHIPYKGGGPALNDIVGGQVQLMSGPMISALPFVKAGRLKALAVTTDKRIAGLPEVPAIAETVPGYESSIWHGVLAPSRTPRSIIMRLHDEIVKILEVPEVRERFAREGAETVGNTPEQFSAFIKSETLKYAKLIKAAGIRAD